jgi:hypothetical protein
MRSHCRIILVQHNKEQNQNKIIEYINENFNWNPQEIK